MAKTPHALVEQWRKEAKRISDMLLTGDWPHEARVKMQALSNELHHRADELSSALAVQDAGLSALEQEIREFPITAAQCNGVELSIYVVDLDVMQRWVNRLKALRGAE